MIDFGSGYQSIQEFMEGDIEEADRAWYDKYYGYTSGMPEEEYIQKQQAVFVKFMEENQVLIQRARYSDAYRTNTEWVIEYTVTENVVNSGLDRHDLNPPSFLDIFFRKFE